MIERQATVTVAVKGRHTGKPRPWLMVQNDAFSQTDSITLCMLTQTLLPEAPLLRIDIAPSRENGLRATSQIQVEKIVTVRRDDVDQQVGRLEDVYMAEFEEALRYFLGL